MKPRTLRYLAGEGVRGIRRHRGLTATAVVTMTASLLVLGVFLVTSYNVRRVIQGLESRKEVMVYLSDGLKPTDLADFEHRAKLHSAVASLTFVSREEAWAEFSARMEVDGLLDAVGSNPLPDAFRIELRPAARNADAITALSQELSGWEAVDEVLSGGEWVGRLDEFARSVLLFTAAIGLAVGLSIIAIVSSTVRLTVVARQDLIHIMRVVGASEGFIRVPFLSEGVLQAFFAGILALVALYGATRAVASRFAGVEFLSPGWCAGFLLLAVLLGLVGSSFSVRHVLRQANILRVMKRRSRLLSVVAAAILVATVGAHAQSPDLEKEIRKNAEQLETLRQRAEEARRSAREAARQEKSVLSRLTKADKALRATRDYLHRLEMGQRVVQEQIRETTIELSWARDELTARRDELRRRVRFTYMHDRSRALEIVFSSESLPMLLQRAAFMNRVLDQDRRLIEQVTARESQVKETLSRLQSQKAEMDALLSEKQREERQYATLKEERAQDLNQIRDEKSAQEAVAKELEDAAQQLERVLADLDRKRREAVLRKDPALAKLDLQDFGKNRGRLPWPAQGQVITQFGRQQHPKYKTVIVSNGVDIAAPAGTPVSSVGPGIVDLVQWLPGYGETVIVNHGRGFYSIYGHLGSVAVRPDDRVDPGHVLGTVGETGSLKGVCLHFEIRSGGEAQDPLMWLR